MARIRSVQRVAKCSSSLLAGAVSVSAGRRGWSHVRATPVIFSVSLRFRMSGLDRAAPAVAAVGKLCVQHGAALASKRRVAPRGCACVGRPSRLVLRDLRKRA